MTRSTELLSLAERLEFYGDNDRDSAAAILRKLAELRPVAWRYQDSRDNYRYRSYKAGFNKDYSILKPVALYQLSEVLTDE